MLCTLFNSVEYPPIGGMLCIGSNNDVSYDHIETTVCFMPVLSVFCDHSPTSTANPDNGPFVSPNADLIENDGEVRRIRNIFGSGPYSKVGKAKSYTMKAELDIDNSKLCDCCKNTRVRNEVVAVRRSDMNNITSTNSLHNLTTKIVVDFEIVKLDGDSNEKDDAKDQMHYQEFCRIISSDGSIENNIKYQRGNGAIMYPKMEDGFDVEVIGIEENDSKEYYMFLKFREMVLKYVLLDFNNYEYFYLIQCRCGKMSNYVFRVKCW